MLKNKINILLYKNSIKVGGAEKQLLLLSNNLPKSIFTVYVAAYEADERLMRKLSKVVEFLKLPGRKTWKNVFSITKFIRKNSIDICHTWDFRSSIVGFLSTRFTKARFIDGSIRSAPSKKMFKKLFALKLQKIMVKIHSLLRIHIVSNSYAGLRSYGIHNYNKAAVIYNGFKKEEIADLSKSETSKNVNVCMAANMRWKKDFLTFIKAGLEILKVKQDVKFYLIGDGQDKQKYIDFLKENQFKNNFTFTGFVDNAIEYIDKMDICVLCNDISGEGLSNSIMEYMSCKKPVIATGMGGNPELIIDKKTGFLIKEKDHLELSSKILYLTEKPEERKIMGKKGYVRLFELCGIEKMINKYENLYEKVLGNE